MSRKRWTYGILQGDRIILSGSDVAMVEAVRKTIQDNAREEMHLIRYEVIGREQDGQKNLARQ